MDGQIGVPSCTSTNLMYILRKKASKATYVILHVVTWLASQHGINYAYIDSFITSTVSRLCEYDRITE